MASSGPSTHDHDDSMDVDEAPVVSTHQDLAGRTSRSRIPGIALKDDDEDEEEAEMSDDSDEDDDEEIEEGNSIFKGVSTADMLKTPAGEEEDDEEDEDFIPSEERD